jgi:hypothetical protein
MHLPVDLLVSEQAHMSDAIDESSSRGRNSERSMPFVMIAEGAADRDETIAQ